MATHNKRPADSASVTARGAASGASWDFSKIAVFPPDRASHPQPSSPASATLVPSGIQAKLAIGSVDDPLEHEADCVADQVMRMPDSVSIGASPPQVSPKCATCEEDGKRLQLKPAGATVAARTEAPTAVHDALRSPGQPLDDDARAFFEPRFGHDFSRVRIHRDSRAAASAQAVRAHAYTVGNSIVFGNGQFRFANPQARKLIAHELAHVAQQGCGTAEQKSFLLQRQEIDENELPENYPDWQHGAPTKPVSPDPHVQEIPAPNQVPDQGPYRTPGNQPPTQADPSTGSTWSSVLKVVIALGLSVALIATIVAALADPEPASKLALAGLTLVEIGALAAALGFKPPSAPSSAPGA